MRWQRGSLPGSSKEGTYNIPFSAGNLSKFRNIFIENHRNSVDTEKPDCLQYLKPMKTEFQEEGTNEKKKEKNSTDHASLSILRQDGTPAPGIVCLWG